MGAYSRPSAQASMKSNASSQASEQQRSGASLVATLGAGALTVFTNLGNVAPKIEHVVGQVSSKGEQVVAGKSSFQALVGSPLFKGANFKPETQLLTEALNLNSITDASQPQVAFKSPKQVDKAIANFKSQYNPGQLILASMGHQGTIDEMAQRAVKQGLGSIVEAQLKVIAQDSTNKHHKLAQKGLQSLKTARTASVLPASVQSVTASASLQTVPSQGWGGQNIQDAAAAARKYLQSNPNGLYAEDAQRILNRYDELRYFLANGTPEEKSIAYILTQELSLVPGSGRITKQDGLLYSTIVPGTSIIGMTDAQRYTALIDFNQGVGANVTPETLNFFEQLLNPTSP
jgi:hypothetical protein